MSLTQEQMLEVMQYADGELLGDDVDRVERFLGENPEAKELFDSIEALGDGVRHALDLESIDVRDGVMGNLRPNDLDKVRLRRVARTRVAIVSATILAVAAAVMLIVRQNGGKSPIAHTEGSGSESALASASTTGVQVDFVDTPSAVSVFYVPASATGSEEQGAETAPSVVVWVDDTK
jgi:anti-sigma factor RsiW